jgi:hypothetical protein
VKLQRDAKRKKLSKNAAGDTHTQKKQNTSAESEGEKKMEAMPTALSGEKKKTQSRKSRGESEE